MFVCARPKLSCLHRCGLAEEFYFTCCSVSLNSRSVSAILLSFSSKLLLLSSVPSVASAARDEVTVRGVRAREEQFELH